MKKVSFERVVNFLSPNIFEKKRLDSSEFAIYLFNSDYFLYIHLCPKIIIIMNFRKNKQYDNNNHVKSEKGKIKDFIEQSKQMKKTYNKASVLSSFTDLLYSTPSSFIAKFEEIKGALLNNEDYFDSMDNSLFYHYFIAIESARASKNDIDYDLLHKNILNFVGFFHEKVTIYNNS
jgi:hypothetical protein